MAQDLPNTESLFDFLSGDHYVLGVLDAIPCDDYSNHQHQNELRIVISTMLQELMELMGRPNTCYGMTPIAIFRVIKPKK